jgi:XTP/dITP diphosphohydrolase
VADPAPLTLVLASANPDKAAEIAQILTASLAVDLRPRPPSVPDVEETGDTLVANARLKARALAEATGLPAVADDTGLEVAALGGAPGVYSARYAGPEATYADNVAKLLGALGSTADRRARFVTVALVAYPDGREVAAEGAVTGTIAPAPRGEGGFGYDPVFVPDEGDGRTFAEMAPDEKNQLSHRGRAFRALAGQLAGAEGPGAGAPGAAEAALPELVGRVLGRARVVVERGPVQNFATAVFDENPLYRDRRAATAAGFADVPVPPTYPLAFETWGRLAELQPEDARPFSLPEVLEPLVAAGGLVLHGEQAFDYHRTPVVGDVLEGESRVVDVDLKESRGRRLHFLVIETAWRDQAGQPVVDSRFTVIVRF